MFGQSNDAQGLEMLDILTMISFIMQVSNYQELKRQTSTDDIYNELRRQDREYLDKIISNQMRILSKLDALLDCRNVAFDDTSPQG